MNTHDMITINNLQSELVKVVKENDMLKAQLYFAMEALNFYAKQNSFGGNCARDALDKIEREKKKGGEKNG